MEHAAKPRDNLSDWRPPSRDASSRLATPTHSVLLSDAARTSDSPDNNTSVAVNASNGENDHAHPPSLPPSSDVNVSTSTRPVSLAHPFSTPLPPPVVTVPSVGSNMQSVSPPTSNTASRHAALPPLEPQRDVLMTSETAALQHGCTQPLPKSHDVKRLAQLRAPYLSTPAAVPCSDEAKRGAESFFTPGSTALCSLRERGGAHAVDTPGVGCNVLSNAAPKAAFSTQNIQLEAPTCEQGRSELQAAQPGAHAAADAANSAEESGAGRASSGVGEALRAEAAANVPGAAGARVPRPGAGAGGASPEGGGAQGGAPAAAGAGGAGTGARDERRGPPGVGGGAEL
ncbi:rod shape-determining protein MreC [Gracilaria domingensis]|nr:rod shape-determining protein MreC [Gracilaria domingensis]